jgi:23S rRNA pseudouridine1911/1915/1917 synthase
MAERLVVLHEDPHLLAVVKPSGVLTQGTPAGEMTLEAAVREHLGRDGTSPVYLGTVHRLDRPVSWVVVWARTPKAARRLAAQFEAREVAKEYWAIVERAGAPELPAEATWDDWLADPDAMGLARVVAPGTPGARRAITRSVPDRAERTPEGTAWLRLRPETGRTHQLRVQAARRGCPILGDVAYGARGTFPGGIALHARTLRILHPILRQPLRLVAPVPPSWAERGILLPGSSRDVP